MSLRSSKHLILGAVSLVTGALYCESLNKRSANLASRNSQGPSDLSPTWPMKWCLSNPGSRGCPPSQQGPRDDAATKKK